MFVYGIIAILCVLGIIVLINRAWIKRNRKLEKIICIVSIVLLMVFFVFSIGKFIKQKNEVQRISKEYLQIMDEKGEFYFLDSEGNVVKEYKTIGQLLKEYFIYDVFDGNTNISQKEYNKNNFEIFIIGVLLITYWVILLVLYEKENSINNYAELDDYKILDKYNPMLAACIAQNRSATGKDLVAVILNLIEKGKINLRIVPDEASDKVKYKYMISPNGDSKYHMDMVEKFINDWIFEKVPDFIKNRTKYEYISENEEGIIEINLLKRIKSFSEEDDTYSKLKEIQKMNESRLKDIGANKKSVPAELLFVNNIVMIFVLIATCSHIYVNGLGIQITNVHVLLFLSIMLLMLFVLPIVYIFSLVTLKTIVVLFKSTEEMGKKRTGRALITKSISIIITTMVLMIIILFLPIDTYLVYDIFAIGMGLLVISTDNYMLKHSDKILLDYYNLKRIENKIKECSLLEEKNIEYIKTWEKYFVYSVALGIPLEVKKDSEISYSNLENLIINKTDLQAIYFVCKSYFEYMWDFNFEEEEKLIKIISDIKNNI